MKPKAHADKTSGKAAPLDASGRHAHGPEPERLKISGDWKEAVRTALRKPKPLGGWPKG
jgi:hypothetical protein